MTARRIDGTQAAAELRRAVAADGCSAPVGDVAHDELAAHAAATTPVPGGVGPVIIAAPLANTVEAARLRAEGAARPVAGGLA